MSPRSHEKRRAIMALYREGMNYPAIASIVGGTPDGVRSTLRKMVERGTLPKRCGHCGRLGT